MTPLELARHEAEEAGSFLLDLVSEFLEDPKAQPWKRSSGNILQAMSAYRQRHSQQREAEELAYLENAKP